MSKKRHKQSLAYTDTNFLLAFIFIEKIMRRQEVYIQDVV